MTPEELSEHRSKFTGGALLLAGSHRGVPFEVRSRRAHAAHGRPTADVPGHAVAVALPHTEAIDAALWGAPGSGDALPVVAGRELYGYSTVVRGDRGARWHVLVAVTGAPATHYRAANPTPWDGPASTPEEAEALARSWIDAAVAEGYAPDAR